MRMRRKKNLDSRMELCADRVTNMQVEDRHFGADDHRQWLDFAAIFGNDNPVNLEIGCGKGGFICEIARQHPEMNFVAVEKYGNVLVTACERAAAMVLNNVWFLWGDAEYLPRFIPTGSIARLYLNFSTPFPKKRYAIHRLTHRHFLELYKGLLVPGATVEQKTDDRGLFQFSLEEFSQTGYTLQRVSLDLHADDYPNNIVTEYEQRFMDEGLPIYRVEATSPLT
ncbi:MAG: tRNA (guanosine(46)-N7)-methyltransferase TrmB [Ruminococcaceae bacterium]|nr:tRNA (guanosine(46)-N7)-methyltransferase TrmB [Oscillospiraceae bacterium]